MAQLELDDDDLDRAIRRLLALPPTFPAFDAAQIRLADACERSGRSMEAVAIHERLFLAPGTAPANKSHAASRLCALRSGIPDDVLLRYFDHEATHENHLLVGFARAALLMRAPDRAAAWEALLAANHAMWVEVRDTARAQQLNYPRILSYCESASVRPIVADGSASATVPILIVGPSRSGKSLVEDLLCGFDKIERGFESDVVPAAIARTARALELPPVGDPWFLDAEAMPKLREEMQRLVAERGRGAAWLTLTSPANIFHVGLVAQIFPAAPIIFVSRDRHDLATSIFATHYGNGHSYSYDLPSLVRYLRWHQDMVAAWKQKLGDRAITLRYEELGAGQMDLAAKLGGRLGPSRSTHLPRFVLDAGGGAPYRHWIDAATG